jgi:putative ABC transport system permease protein
MLGLYRLLSLRYLLQRWDRSALIVLSIALGVATFVSTRMLNQSIEDAAGQTTTPLGMGNLFVSNGELGVTHQIADELRTTKIPGVKSVSSLVVERVYLPSLENRAAVLIGLELSDQILNPDNQIGVKVEWLKDAPQLQLLPIAMAIQQGKWEEAGQFWRRVPGRFILVSRAIHEYRKQSGGEKKPLLVRFGTREELCLPVGVFDYDPKSPMAALGQNIIGMELGQGARFVRPGPISAVSAIVGSSATEPVWDVVSPWRVNRLDIFLEPTAPIPATQQTIQALVRDRAEVRTPEMQGQSTQEIIGGLQVGFMLCSAGAMVVGLFLVYNALSVTVAERRHDIGILRSIGATRSQIIAVFGIAALVLGLLGAALGLPMGILLARTMLLSFQSELSAMFINPTQDPAWPTWSTIGYATLAGITTAILAALLPAIQAAMQDPADAVRRVPGVAGGVWKLAHRATCGTLIAGGVIMILTRDIMPPRVGAFLGLTFALIGMLLSAPIAVGIMVQLLHPLLRRLLPIEARLAADNLLRSPGRTGLVIGALGAGVAVMVQTAGVGRSNEEPVVKWLDEVIQADQFIFAGNLAEATSSQTPMQGEITADLRKLPDVTDVTGIRYVRPEFNGTIVFLIAMDCQSFAEQTSIRQPNLATHGLNRLRELAGENAVLVSDNFAVRHRIGPGDTLSLPGTKGQVTLKVVGTVRDYSWSRGTIFIDRAVYAQLFQDQLVDVCHVFTKSSDTIAARLNTFASDKGLTVQDRPTVRKFLAGLIDRVYAIAYLQQVIVGIVASLGVVTSLLISVLQRKRELGLLLAVGATPAQVLRSVLWEAALMGFFGTILGILMGLPLEWYILKVVLVEESGFVFDVVIPWRQAFSISAGAILLATLAGLFPALHAIRTRIPDAILYE